MELGGKFGVRGPFSSRKRKNKKWGNKEQRERGETKNKEKRCEKDREKGGQGETGSKKLTLDKFIGELYIYFVVYNFFCGG